jgi:hypothetical protein
LRNIYSSLTSACTVKFASPQINVKAAACILITAVASMLRLFSNAAVQPAVADVIVAVGIPVFDYVPAKTHMLKLSVASFVFAG